MADRDGVYVGRSRPADDLAPDPIMELQINGERESFDAEELTVAELLERLEVERTEGLAVAVDARVVSRSRWSETTLETGAEVEIIRATQGG